MTDKHFDIVIAGGGLVGASLAIALGKTACRIALIDLVPWEVDCSQQFDVRSIALALSSMRILQGCGVWPTLSHVAYPIRQVNVSDKGHFGKTRLHAADHDLAALGYVVPFPQLQQTLNHVLQQLPNVTCFKPDKLRHFSQDTHTVHCELEKNGALQAQCMIAADGAQSFIRSALNITVREKTYQQTAIVSNVITSSCHQQIALERFTPTGSSALLPLAPYHSACVMTVPTVLAQHYLHCSDADYLQHVQDNFGYPFGAFTQLGRRFGYPLKQLVADKQVQDNIVLLGNAAHTVSPITAQGFNLGLRDVAVLAELIHHACQAETAVDYAGVFKQYASMRQADHQRVLQFTDNMNAIFSNAWLPHVVLRNLGLMGINLLPNVKRAFTERAMGFAHTQARLLSGEPLSMEAAHD